MDQLFSDSLVKDGTFPATIADTYYKPSGESKLLADVVSRNQQEYRRLLGQAVAQGQISEGERLEKERRFAQGQLGPNGSPSLSPLLRELENEQFCLLKHTQQCADGLYRPRDYYVSPGSLNLTTISQGWETRKDTSGQQVPIADTVIIGAGPGGLSTAWQLARRGGRVVVFESEIAGAAFSDAGAKPVHSLRTSADGTNLVQEGRALATLEHPLSLHGHLAQHRSLAMQGQLAEANLTGVPVQGVAPESHHPQDRNAPAARGEFFEHLAQITDSLANDFENAFLCERSPVKDVKFSDGLFTVTSSRGHKMMCKNLVLATGLTGPAGEQARPLQMFRDLNKDEPGKMIVLSNDSDSSQEAVTMSQMANGEEKRALVVHDRQLGSQLVRQSVMGLPAGTRAAVVGSGESAVKGALELLNLNPSIKVDLFVKNKLEAAQTQLPNENFHTAVLENTIQDSQASEKAWDRLELFDTPVTPRSLEELLEYQMAGRLNLLEMGQHFDSNSVDIAMTPDSGINVRIKSKKAQDQLKSSHQEFLTKGLVPDASTNFKEATYGLVVEAVGYQKKNLQEHPLRHLPPEAHQKMHLNTAGLPFHPAETSLAGLSVRGRQLADQLAEEIPAERRIEITVPQDRGIDWREVDPETVDGIIENRGVHPGFARSVRREVEEFGSHPQAIRLKLPSTDNKLRELHHKREQGKITNAEREVLERAEILAERMDPNP